VRPIPISPVNRSVARHPNTRPASDWLKTGARPSAEVVVIGTGAGGAAAGVELARKGKKVLFLEMGRAYDEKDFKKKSLVWSTLNIYQESGLQLSQGNMPTLLISGRGVGGSTLINSAICFRPPDDRLNEWADFVGDDRLRPDAMRPIVDEIWQRIGVFRTHEGIGRRHNSVFRDGAAALGLSHAWMDRSAPACVGCGVCHLGCPSGGKASVDRSLLPHAMELGAEIRTGAKAERIVIEGGRATGVVVTVLDDEGRPAGEVQVRADRVMIAGSAIRTPVLLDASGVENPMLGRGLAIHPAGAALAEFAEPVNMWSGVPQGYWATTPGDDRVLVETQSLNGAELFALFGRPGKLDLLKRMPHWTLGGGMVRDEARGTVTNSGGAPRIGYDFNARELENIKSGVRIATQVYFAAGARAVCPLIHPLRFYEREDEAVAAIDAVRDVQQMAHVHASHPHGAARMGPSADTAVCDRDGKVFGHEELYVVDGSLFPTTLGVNPQVSIMSLAAALGRRMVA
jgi:choline dehydrogenase-like flavoprotein